MKMDKILSGKKGSSELNTPLKVFGVIFGLIILGFLTIVVAGNLNDPNVIPTSTSKISNQTLGEMNDSGFLTFDTTSYCGTPRCGDIAYMYITGNGTPFLSNNWTQANCKITGVSDLQVGLNETEWAGSYTLTHTDCSLQHTMRNTTGGVATFFSNLSTIYTIAFVVMIIAMIMIVWTISKKATVGGGTSGGRESKDFIDL